MVRQRVDALRAQELGRLLDRLAAERVDDAGASRVAACERMNAASCRRGSTFALDAVLDVRPVEARHEVPRVRQAQALGDLAVGRGGRGGGEGEARDAGEALGEVAQREVVGPEVVAPLRHAVRLVDRDDAEPAARQQEPQRRLGVEPLGRDVEQVELAGEVRLLDGRRARAGACVELR